MFFSPFSIAITSLGEERVNLSDFCTFVRFALVWFCLFSRHLGVWEGLRLWHSLDFSLTFFNDLIEWTFIKEGFLYLACNGRNAFFTSKKHRNHTLWLGQKACEALSFLLDSIYVRSGTKLFRQIVGTNCTALVANLFLFCYERDFIMSEAI